MSDFQQPRFMSKPPTSTGSGSSGGSTTISGLALEPVVNGEEIVYAGEAGNYDVLTVVVEVT